MSWISSSFKEKKINKKKKSCAGGKKTVESVDEAVGMN
jgi:hypothetical protein